MVLVLLTVVVLKTQDVECEVIVGVVVKLKVIVGVIYSRQFPIH